MNKSHLFQVFQEEETGAFQLLQHHTVLSDFQIPEGEDGEEEEDGEEDCDQPPSRFR